MNRLFIELYLDEDVDVLLATLVRARGFSVTTTVEAGRIHASDEEQLSFARTRGLAIVTHNRVGFEQLADARFAAGEDHPGIVIAARRSPYEIARRLLVILNAVTADEMVNQLRYI